MNRLVSLQAYSGKKICVACSGGADSVALLHHFYKQAGEYGIEVSAVTCEHGIRGENSLRDAAFVLELCAEWKIPLFSYSADIPARAKESGRGLEEEARIFRYSCFSQLMEKGEADAVATAHHKDDCIETALFRLARGTSLGGLAAVREREGIVRPFLGVERAQIEEYMRENCLPFVTDESNADLNFARNRLRALVIPELERAVAGAKENIYRFALRAKEDEDYLRELASRVLVREADEVRVPVSVPAPLFTRTCVLAMKEFGILRDYTCANVGEIAALRAVQSGKRVCLPFGVEAWREGGDIVFCKPRQPMGEEIPFAEGSFVFGNYTVEVKHGRRCGALYADAAAFPEGCTVRVRRTGDMFTPFGGKRKTLKKFLTDRKIPARVSNFLPVAASGSEVYAVFGVEIADCVKVTEQTREIISLTAERLK